MSTRWQGTPCGSENVIRHLRKMLEDLKCDTTKCEGCGWIDRKDSESMKLLNTHPDEDKEDMQWLCEECCDELCDYLDEIS